MPVTLAVPEPNTWRDLLRVVDERKDLLPLAGKRLAVQEYGESNPELLAGLSERGACVTRVPVYQWALPEDTKPLREAVEAIANADIDMALFTTSVQIVHLLRIAREMNKEQELRRGFAAMVVGSIGPVTSAEVREQGFHVDFEPKHPKMGYLVNEAAQHASAMLNRKQRGISS